MPCILNIETSTTACSVALESEKKIIFNREEIQGPSHASLLGRFCDDAIRFAREQNITLDAIAVSCGPGSYTGLRIGVSEAKGLCYGMGIPLIAINTLLIMASKIVVNNILPGDFLLCPMIDARRMEVYTAVYNKDLEIVKDIGAEIIDRNSFEELLDKNKIVFFGNGSGKCKDLIVSDNAVFLEDVYPLASDMVLLSGKAYSDKDFVDAAYFEPFYLKEFVATTPKNKVIEP